MKPTPWGPSLPCPCHCAPQGVPESLADGAGIRAPCGDLAGRVWRYSADAGGGGVGGEGTRQVPAYLRASPPHLRTLGCPPASIETGRAGRAGPLPLSPCPSRRVPAFLGTAL